MPPTELSASLAKLDGSSPLYATLFVDALLAAARESGASDVHLHPTPQGLLVRWRIDGVLQALGEFPRGAAADVVSRLKVLAELLTYKTDVPQEGRIRREGLVLETRARAEQKTAAAKSPALALSPSPSVEMRVSTFPSLHGERAVVRLFAEDDRYLHLADLKLSEEIETGLRRQLGETSGAILIAGPAGSGKTTTAYACLREVVALSRGQRNIVTLEDPVEAALAGVSQSQVQPAAGFTLATGLRSLMRQDPEVILVGEIRDRETVETVFQAALTGHLVLSTFHAGSAAGALSRLLEMGIEPYLLTSGVRTILHQRLLRRLCECSVALPLPLGEGSSPPGELGEGMSVKASVESRLVSKVSTLTPALSQREREPSSGNPDFLGLPVTKARQATGCDRCRHTGYRGRLPLAELLPPLIGPLAQAVLRHADLSELSRLVQAAGMTTVFSRACVAAMAGQTDPAEVRRVLGFLDENPRADG